MSPWFLSDRGDPKALPIADRHYNRQKPGTPQFVPPGRCCVLLTADAGALWVTSWPFAEYVRHEWPGAWINSAFRRESGPLASELITAAISATRWVWPQVPAIPSAVGPVGLVTFIDRDKVRHKRDFGRCYLRAGFEVIGETKGGLLALGMRESQMPKAAPPQTLQMELYKATA